MVGTEEAGKAKVLGVKRNAKLIVLTRPIVRLDHHAKFHIPTMAHESSQPHRPSSNQPADTGRENRKGNRHRLYYGAADSNQFFTL